MPARTLRQMGDNDNEISIAEFADKFFLFRDRLTR
ncbi:hypothetical protein EDD55_10318 [Varunaivibrio sulfuroxidans]|uniref:Uncharacterized protein n=1 Tax=Varunaivibrio sulfuroxidans TaxID=1773489 RepID=A0A4R3JCK2_9PROT|nr:hypothetical protein EDD55_10318 [Varunaivibrio sulfuroxidans]